MKVSNSDVIEVREFGKTSDGRAVKSFTLHGGFGAELEVLDYGGKVRRLSVPDRNGACENVAMSLDFSKPGFGGSLIGRYANRIAGGKFAVDGQEFSLPTNIAPDGMPCLLHGGAAGFHDKIWQARPIAGPEGESLELKLSSPDGEGGFPGNLDVTCIYTFTKKNTWRIEWTATTDKPTPVNFTHHVYFNLSGESRRPVSDEVVRIAADGYTPTGVGQITTGEIAPVEGTDFDFRTAKAIGERLSGAYDNNWVLSSQDGSLAFAASAEDAGSGRRIETWTTERGMQFYSGFALNDGLRDQFGRNLFPLAAFAFETQAHPDSVNKPNWPDTVLRPGQVFKSITEYRFGVA